VALPAAAGFAATALGRVIGLLVIAPLALVVGARDLREARRLARQATADGDAQG
jgi:integral membrane sensor domain MASE1